MARREYENDEPIDDPLVVLDLLERGWNDSTIRTIERWPHSPVHVEIVHCRDFSDSVYERYLVTERVVNSLKVGRDVAGTPKWGYTEDRSLRITEVGSARLWAAREALGDIPRASHWLRYR